jgi:hypothetical protein
MDASFGSFSYNETIQKSPSLKSKNTKMLYVHKNPVPSL